MKSMRFAGSIAIAALALSSAACQSWNVERRPVETVVSDGSGPVAVTMNDRRWVVLKDARVTNDSIVGTRIAGNTYGNARTALAVTGVRVVEKRSFSPVKSMGIGVAAAFVPSLYRLAAVEND
jgi:hypothetical protein